mgnify:CR=1 FL=1
MKIIVFVSKTGDWLVSFVAAILATVMLLYGGYALGYGNAVSGGVCLSESDEV